MGVVSRDRLGDSSDVAQLLSGNRMTKKPTPAAERQQETATG